MEKWSLPGDITMTDICLFAGTTEGRRLVRFLEKQDVNLTVCVATEYGGKLLASSDGIRVINKRLPPEEMIRLLTSNHFDLVIDATHPYAEQVTENIYSACCQTGTPFMRLLRSESDLQEGTIIVPDTAASVTFLEGTTGNILLTTGSKELAKFASLPDFSSRVYARVLPMKSSLDACSDAGLMPSHIIAMQGPFSEEMNRVLLRMANAEWLVTKDSGDIGGFEAKAIAAVKENAHLLVIGRPPQKEGLSENEIISCLCNEYGFTRQPAVKIIGIGPGNRNSMTLDALYAIENADCLIGARRILETADHFGKASFEAISEQTISEFIHTHSEYSSFAVLMSGDTSFFSGTKRLLPLLSDCDVEVMPGISSLSYLCSRLNVSCEDIHSVSLHGRTHNIIPDVRSNNRLFVLTGGENTVSSICGQLDQNGLGNVLMTVGERLSYPDEKITSGTPNKMANRSYAPLSVILLENDHPDMIVTHGLPDSIFLRDSGSKGLIPMTKSEVRSVCLSKLQLTERSVCWDIGAGTGSVAIEMALQSKKGHVYAIERDESAVELIKTNSKRLNTENLTVVSGTAPQICADLPTPSHVFIGGSSGNLREIILDLLARRSKIRITATAVSLNGISELTEIIRTFPVTDTDVVMIQTSHGKKAGPYHLMLGGNPVYIFSMCISGDTQ